MLTFWISVLCRLLGKWWIYSRKTRFVCGMWFKLNRQKIDNKFIAWTFICLWRSLSWKRIFVFNKNCSVAFFNKLHHFSILEGSVAVLQALLNFKFLKPVKTCRVIWMLCFLVSIVLWGSSAHDQMLDKCTAKNIKV